VLASRRSSGHAAAVSVASARVVRDEAFDEHERPERALEVADRAVDHQNGVFRRVEHGDRNAVGRLDAEELVRVAPGGQRGNDDAGDRERHRAHGAATNPGEHDIYESHIINSELGRVRG